jgi:hypothetical protein
LYILHQNSYLHFEQSLDFVKICLNAFCRNQTPQNFPLVNADTFQDST